MQPQDPFNLQPPAAPDLPDAALPAIEPIRTEAPLPATAPAPAPTPPPQVPTPAPQNNLLPQQPAQQKQKDPNQGKEHLSGVGKKYFNLIEFDDEEVLLAEIRKHPFGLFIILATGMLIAIVLFAAVTAIASSDFLSSLGFGNLNAVVVFAGFLLSIFVIAITLVNAHLYRNNVVFVTNEKLAQVLFITLFNRKISQLSIGDVQDVTVQQNGFLPNMVGYGTLVVETAGEQQNYTFSFVPKPYETSKIVINAHESNLKQYGN
jgi:hypothetical protein